MIVAGGSGGPAAIGEAVGWIVDLVTGSLATLVAVLAVASLGFALLQGQVQIQRAALVILGCFVLFGAHGIAEGIMQLATGTHAASAGLSSASPRPPTVTAPPAYDPYAGASVPD